MSSTQDVCIRCSTNKARRRGLCDACRVADPVANDLQLAKMRTQVGDLQGKYATALKTIDRLETSLGISNELKSMAAPFAITPAHGHGTSEATAMLVASDWHVEQKVTSRETNGLNEFTLDIAHDRATRFFTAGLRLIRLLNRDVKIYNVVLPLLGDFITGEIHGAENAAKNQLPPTQAIVFAQNHLISGIEFLLDQSPYTLTFVCKIGNHSRVTEKTRFGQENGYSYEYLMYLHLQAYFKAEKRVRFILDDGYHTYYSIYDYKFRIHHGHGINYQGGVGGLFVPAFQKINKWNKAIPANCDIFGHHHQYLDGGVFHCNGSLIGFDGRAEALGFGCEPPMQTLLLVDKKRGQTCKWPVLVADGRGR